MYKVNHKDVPWQMLDIVFIMPSNFSGPKCTSVGQKYFQYVDRQLSFEHAIVKAKKMLLSV